MLQALVDFADRTFPNKEILTLMELAQILDCEPHVIQNWVKRSDSSKRPPRLILGNSLKFPKREVLRWVVETQSGR